jgi:hypothetical protein
MENFMPELVAEFLKLHGDNTLQFVAVARRRTLVGVDCDLRTQVNLSCLDLDPMNVVAYVFKLAWLPLNFVYQGADGIPTDCYHSEIARILHAELVH